MLASTTVYVIYKRPADLPQHPFVVRGQTAYGDIIVPHAEYWPFGNMRAAQSWCAARGGTPFSSDLPHVVQEWMEPPGVEGGGMRGHLPSCGCGGCRLVLTMAAVLAMVQPCVQRTPGEP